MKDRPTTERPATVSYPAHDPEPQTIRVAFDHLEIRVAIMALEDMVAQKDKEFKEAYKNGDEHAQTLFKLVDSADNVLGKLRKRLNDVESNKFKRSQEEQDNETN